MMDTTLFEQKWNRVRSRAIHQWGKLSNAELDRIRGRREILEGLIREKYGRSRDEARREVDTFLNTDPDADPHTGAEAGSRTPSR